MDMNISKEKEIELTEEQQQEMKEHQERDKKVTHNLMEALGIDTKIPNIMGFMIDVDGSDPKGPQITVGIKTHAGSDGMAHFIRSFAGKFKLEEIIHANRPNLMEKLEDCNTVTHANEEKRKEKKDDSNLNIEGKPINEGGKDGEQ